MTWRRGALLSLVVVIAAVGYWRFARHSAPRYAAEPVPMAATVPQTLGPLGEPRPDLSPAQLAAFQAGKKLFVQRMPTLGPYYNAQACVECHMDPTMGGNGHPERAAFVGPDPSGDSRPYYAYALPGWTVPERPPGVSHRIPPPLYGLGLVEQIPDETIRAACKGRGHPDPAKDQGSMPKNTVARFGAKPFVGTLPDFVDAALFSEMNVTSPIERATDGDDFPDPEVDREFVETLAAFVRGLQPPGRNGNDPVGEQVFHRLECATCHVPDMPPAHGVYSDFCVHGMGEALADGIVDHEAQGDEFRTTPLWGLRFKKFYLHDGRATTLDAAILAHAGEAQGAADAYKAAPDEQRAALLRFLGTL
jgi:CxxC motif-containing protein (DUF1111 family)